MVGDTKPVVKTCSRCGSEKDTDKFIKKRNICKECDNTRKKEKYHSPNTTEDRECTYCNETKAPNMFLKNRPVCNACNNEKRRDRYNTNEAHRAKMIQAATIFKQNKAEERRKKKEEEIGIGNKKCSKCSTIKPTENFRHNRLKCRNCERDEPLEKFKRCVRSRIYIALHKVKKQHTIEYLGTDSKNYLNWILSYNPSYTIDNRGSEWHIDHVIPLSLFNLEDTDEQLIAFNWRNTMPLAAKENLAKNNRVDVSQIEQHYHHLLKYHKEQNIELPQIFIDLFAKYLVAGNPLEPSLPLTNGNICEELG
jgi:uncharacterized protein (DUF983 family)